MSLAFPWPPPPSPLLRHFLPILLLLLQYLPVVFPLLSVSPPVLFLDEDWPLGRPTDAQICTDRRGEGQLKLALLGGNEAGGGEDGTTPLFGTVPLNKTCAGLTLNWHLDSDQKMAAPSNKPALATSFSLLLEDLASKDRAALQVEVVDVNDNAPLFLGGPFPLELVIPQDSPPGFLLRRLEVFDPDQGIGGISRFSLSGVPASSNRSAELFSLEAQHCDWPKCSVELRLRARMAVGERAELLVKARDGAGLARRRTNKAEVKLRVVAVREGAGGGGMDDEEEEEPVGQEKPLALPAEEDKTEEDGWVGGEAEEKLGSNASTTTQTTRNWPETSASLMTFEKKTTTFAPPATAHGAVQRQTTETPQTSLSWTSTASTSTFAPPPPPALKSFMVDPLSEDSPVGLELLRLPLPHTPAGGYQFVQLDGSQSLRMLSNGSIQVANPLDSAKLPELRAEVRAGPVPVAIVQAKVRPMAEQFSQWMDRIVGEYRLGQSDLAQHSEAKRPVRILWLPEAMAKYARLEGEGKEEEWKLEGRELFLLDTEAGRHCCQLELHFRGERTAQKAICVEVPEREVPLEVLWPANNSRHFFKENVPFPVLLTLNATGPPTLSFSLATDSQDDSSSFSIGPQNGQLTFRPGPFSSFDFERQSQFHLTVLVCPTGQEGPKCRRVLLQLEVLDANDHCPAFPREGEGEEGLSIEVSEATRPDPARPIGQFPAAEDGDGSADQRSICYRLEEEAGDGGKQAIFGIQMAQRPELYLLRGLDREQSAIHRLRVWAEDCAWTEPKCPPDQRARANASLAISIRVGDVNDNGPRFVRRHFFGTLLLPAHPGEALLQLRAEDPDEVDRGRLRFGWGEGMVQTEGDPMAIADSPFWLNRSSGELHLREAFAPAEMEKHCTFTFRVRVRDRTPVHEDQASVTISVLEPKKHLLQMSLARSGAQLEPELAHLERLLSALVADRAWLALVQQLTECGSANCSQLAVYFLDRALRPVQAKLALEALRGVERSREWHDLRARFGPLTIEGQSNEHEQMAHQAPSSPVGTHSGAFLLLRRLFALSPLGLVGALLLALLALACPFLCCRLLCRQMRRCRSGQGPKLLATAGLGAFGPVREQFGGVRLVMAGQPGAGMNKSCLGTSREGGEFMAENAYMAPGIGGPSEGGQQQKRLRWQSDSEEFEFPAPPPVRMYGSGTLTIPRPKTVPNAASTEF